MASLDFDQEASAGLFEALSSPERLDDVLLDRLLQKHTDYLSLFTAPSTLDRDFDLDEQAFETVVDVVRGSAPTVIVDVPHMWTNSPMPDPITSARASSSSQASASATNSSAVPRLSLWASVFTRTVNRFCADQA